MSSSNGIPTIQSRSWLFTPATRPDRFPKALASGADVLIADLEDAVPASDKAIARNNVSRVLSRQDGRDTLPLQRLAVRINASSSTEGLSDLLMLVKAHAAPRFVLVPKVESAETVQQIAALFADAGLVSSIVPMIESAAGVDNAAAIAVAAPKVSALMFGAADFASDVGAQPGAFALQVARSRVAAACVTNARLAIDAPCFALGDPEALRHDLRFAADNGFLAKAAIHPSHLAAINEIFSISPERIDWARRVVDAAAKGVAVVDGRMVDEAIAREARRVLAAAG
ncbi:HpcH/HpaI aldolase/citrate lyase family protein [Burkholderia gladioli]|uniref:HpcH/HpaI aldolase/citrate lyase family protein n=1 Tax=Burkholderia gladioli TaxID=28095 RepID=UPI00163E7D9E|nr:aldolase/citrate lyase family protein [Burkholderia gladioli]